MKNLLFKAAATAAIMAAVVVNAQQQQKVVTPGTMGDRFIGQLYAELQAAK